MEWFHSNHTQKALMDLKIYMQHLHIYTFRLYSFQNSLCTSISLFTHIYSLYFYLYTISQFNILTLLYACRAMMARHWKMFLNLTLDFGLWWPYQGLSGALFDNMQWVWYRSKWPHALESPRRLKSVNFWCWAIMARRA